MSEAIILADGRSKDKHIPDPYYLTVGGESLIRRLVRQLNQYPEFSRPRIICSNAHVMSDHLAWGNYVLTLPVDRHEDMGGVAMIPKAIDQMYKEDQHTVFFGDVFFTDDAIQSIYENSEVPFQVHGRSTDNRFTGTPWAEWFAFTLGGDQHQNALRSTRIVSKAFSDRLWHRATPWEWYYEMEGMPWSIPNVRDVPTGPRWNEINDLTDDVDFIEDINAIRKAVGLYG